MDKATCTRCGTVKFVSEFAPDRRRPRGLQSSCNACKAAAQRAAYAADPKKIMAANARWARTHPERARAIKKRWEARHPDHVKTVDRVKARERSRRWSRKNRPYMAEKARRRRALLAATAAADLTPELIAQRMVYWGDRCWMCGGPFEHVDHVKPVAAGGPHCLANLRPACGDCNRRKGAKWPFPTSRSSFRGATKQTPTAAGHGAGCKSSTKQLTPIGSS